MYIILCEDKIDTERIMQQYLSRYPKTSARISRCITEEQLWDKLDQLNREGGLKPEVRFPVKTKKGIRILSLGDIVYCRCEGHMYHVVLRDGEDICSLTIRCSFASVMAPLLSSGDFLQCNASIVVRIDEIKVVCEESLILKGGEEFRFPAGRKAAAKHLLGM